jgi:hypothetical protein
MALFQPGIDVIIVAAHLPKPLVVARDELDLAQPFGAFPEIEVGHDQPYGAAVTERPRVALPAMGDDGVVAGKILYSHVGGIAVIAGEDDVVGLVHGLALPDG